MALTGSAAALDLCFLLFFLFVCLFKGYFSCNVENDWRETRVGAADQLGSKGGNKVGKTRGGGRSGEAERMWEIFRRGVEWTVLDDGLYTENGLNEEEGSRKAPIYVA